MHIAANENLETHSSMFLAVVYLFSQTVTQSAN